MKRKEKDTVKRHTTVVELVVWLVRNDLKIKQNNFSFLHKFYLSLIIYLVEFHYQMKPVALVFPFSIYRYLFITSYCGCLLQAWMNKKEFHIRGKLNSFWLLKQVRCHSQCKLRVWQGRVIHMETISDLKDDNKLGVTISLPR